MCKLVSSYLPKSGVLMSKSTNFSVLDRLGVATVRSVVKSILEGGNLRDVTEPMTRRRVLLSNAALLILYFKMLGDNPELENRLTAMVDRELSSPGKRLAPEKRELLLTLIGMTNKGWDNIVRRESGRASYLRKLDLSLKEIEQEISKEFGQFEAELTVDGVRRKLPTASLLRCMMAIGSQTLAIRGSEKSTYGKLFERLVLGSALSILGFKKVERDDIEESKMVFWLSDPKNKRECDATALITPGLCIRFDIGFIGRGNPEISLDKVTRYDHMFELSNKGKRYRADSHTIIIVDTIGEGSRVKEMARDIGGAIIQMNSSYWVKELADTISQIYGREFKNPLARLSEEESLSFIADRIRDVEFSRFLPIKNSERPIATENRFSVLSEVGDALKFREYLPLYTLKAACSKFSDGGSVGCEGWVRVKGRVGKNENLYVVRAVGHSMEPKIRDGQFCVFENRDGQFDNDDIVLAQERMVADPETGGSYTIKKVRRVDRMVVLTPLNREFDSFSLDRDQTPKVVGIYRGDITVV